MRGAKGDLPDVVWSAVQLDSEIQWIESYVTGDKIYCIYRATSDALIKEHAALAISCESYLRHPIGNRSCNCRDLICESCEVTLDG
jgi:hypothetical protein